MKKLMLAVAIVCAAVMAQAASFNWTTSGNLTTDGSTIATSMTGNFALVYLGDDASAIDWTTATVVDTTVATFTSSMGKTAAKVAATAFNFSMSDYGNGDIFGVVFKADNNQLYYLTDATGAKMEPTYTISGLSDDTSTLDAFDFASSNFQANTSIAVAPEPTSGLLLLLGMAGLALRRRRA